MSTTVRDKQRKRNAPMTQRKRRRTVVAAMVMLGLLVALLCTVVYLAGADRGDDRLLEDGRQKLKRATKEPNEAVLVELAHDARKLLEQYVDEGGEEQQTGRLLLATAMAVEASLDTSQPDFHSSNAARTLKSLQTDQCSTEDLLLCSLSFAQSGDLASADWLVDHALLRSDRRNQSLRLAIDIRSDMMREVEVIELCEKLSKLRPRDPFPLERIIRIREEQGIPRKMIEQYRAFIKKFPDKAEPYRLKLIEQLIETGEAKDARAEFAIIEKNAPALITPIVRAKLLHLEGNYETAHEILSEVLERNDRDMAALSLQAQILLAKNETDEAVAHLEKVLRIKPTDVQTHYLLGQAYARQGNSNAAKQHLAIHERMLTTRVKIHSLIDEASRHPLDVQVRKQIAELYEGIGEAEHASYWRRLADEARRSQR